MCTSKQLKHGMRDNYIMTSVIGIVHLTRVILSVIAKNLHAVNIYGNKVLFVKDSSEVSDVSVTEVNFVHCLLHE